MRITLAALSALSGLTAAPLALAQTHTPATGLAPRAVICQEDLTYGFTANGAARVTCPLTLGTRGSMDFDLSLPDNAAFRITHRNFGGAPSYSIFATAADGACAVSFADTVAPGNAPRALEYASWSAADISARRMPREADSLSALRTRQPECAAALLAAHDRTMAVLHLTRR